MARDHKPLLRRARVLAAAAAMAALTAAGTVLAVTPVAAAAQPKGHDVSSHQKDVDWQSARAKGARFVYVKATESHTYRNPYFGRQYDGARDAGILRGAYHFAVPDKSSGTTQAAYFVRNGGAWRADGWTLPPALDMEYNPYDKKRKCYGLSKARIVSWIQAFSDELERETGRRPVIYTTTHWWNTCTGGSGAFAANHALWLARYDSADTGTLPAGWSTWTFWQYDNSGTLPGDQNLFNGSMTRLKQFAAG
ncbi:lysozyme [Streptomyces mirabilis]|jgi:lysozyme|uniref:lysozyme n=1 Tax=Streptomyces TaxID=1883 RepID=UPI0029B97D7C|nr:lysozyme [Streptomyces sp. AK02-04a]MDX3756580.1 lysozyme [Streptomyces sp. AK02-04a]